jgi:hypothetical protein
MLLSVLLVALRDGAFGMGKGGIHFWNGVTIPVEAGHGATKLGFTLRQSFDFCSREPSVSA